MTELSRPKWPQTTIKASSYLKGRIGWQGLKASEFTDHGPYLITGTDFRDGRIDWSTCYHVTEERFQEGLYIHIHDSDLLITKDGTIGKVAYVTACPAKAVLNSGIFLVRCSDGSYEHRFLYHLLQSRLFDKFLRMYLAGSTINHLYQNVFERFAFPIPDIKVQRRFADILDSIDGQIRQTEELIAKYQQIKMGLIHDLFTRGVTSGGHLRPTQIKAPDLYRGSQIGWIPVDWHVRVIGDILPINVGYVGPVEEHFAGPGEGVPLLSTTNIGSAGFVGPVTNHVTHDFHRSNKKSQVGPGDLLIARHGKSGQAAMVPEWIPEAQCLNVVVIRRGNEILTDFLVELLLFETTRRRLMRYNAGSVQGVVNTKAIARFLIPVPSLAEQERIVLRIAALNASIAAENANFSKQQLMRYGIMNDLLTGRVRMNVADSGNN